MRFWCPSVAKIGGGRSLGQAILDTIAASGKNLDTLTIDDLAPMDQFHVVGKEVTVRLARLPDAPNSPGATASVRSDSESGSTV